MERCFFLAIDLGAESGRTVLGRLEKGKIQIHELTRFANSPIEVDGHLHWDMDRLFREIKRGMTAGLAEAGTPPASLAVDTWGVDFGLLDDSGRVLGLPYCDRDSLSQGAMEEFFKRIPRNEVYERTGIQFLPFNTLFQVFALAQAKPDLLARAETLLFMPDLFDYLLTGQKFSEFTIASTSQLMNAYSGAWDDALLSAVGAAPGLMQPIVNPGTILGKLSPPVCRETGFEGTSVIATASHDTAAAVAAVPASGGGWAYISSGTWSMLGMELSSPLINADALASNFTNEGGVGGRIRFLKNITGLWLLQRCRREWSSTGTLDYDQLTQLAGEARPFGAFIDPDYPDFLNPVSMVEAIARFCRRTGQSPPLSISEVVRCILESLALKYRWTLDELGRLTGKAIRKIHIVGGGSRNEMLCRFTADATNLPVFSGPVEATAIGNIMVQAMALGEVGSLEEIRTIVRESTESRCFEPGPAGQWERAYARFGEILELSRESRRKEVE